MKTKSIKGTSTTVAEAPVKTKKSTANASTTVKKKKPVVDSEVEKPLIKSKSKKAKLDEANAVSATKKAITDKKDLKYIYPKEADDIPKRKKFRAEVRRKVRAMEKELFKLEASKNKEDQELAEAKRAKYERYCGKVYTLN